MIKNLKNDLPASFVVFLVALPLCLGISLASDAPSFSGIIAGIIGGIIVGAISGSPLGVSGPAAGLATIVASAITDLGTFEIFLCAVIISGAMQVLLGLLKAGIVGYYFPSSVIKGMLVGIGITIFLKQIPHAVGFDDVYNYIGSLSFFRGEGANTLTDLYRMFSSMSLGAVVLTLISVTILIVWDGFLVKKISFIKIIPASLLVVVAGVIFYVSVDPSSALAISSEHLVNVPTPDKLSGYISEFSFPDFSGFLNYQVWITGTTIAIVASLETLLSVEAIDKIDPKKRITPPNRELVAQGCGNMISGFVGGLPITQVIVRSSANAQSGGVSKTSTILHGILLLIAVVAIPTVLNTIPLAVLASILLVIGYKLASPKLFKQIYKLGLEQFIPFIITVIGVVFLDLLQGIGLGLGVGIISILYQNYKNSHFLHKTSTSDGHVVRMRTSEEVTFLNKGAILKELNEIPENSDLEIDVRSTIRMNYDIIELFDDFLYKAKEKNISITVIRDKETIKDPSSFVELFIGISKIPDSH